MRKISFFTVTAALLLAGAGAWAASTTQSRVDARVGDRIDVSQITMTAPGMPAEEFVDYTFVF
jgi:hypothetical protein